MWDIKSKKCVLLSKSYKNDKGLGHSAQEWLWDKRKVSKSALLNVGLPMCLFVPLSAYVSNAHPSRNITTSSAALVITAKTVTPTLSHQIGAPHVSFSSSRWYIGPTSLHLSSLCTWQIVQLHVVWLFQSTGCTLLSWLLFVIQFLLPKKLASAQGGRGRQTRNCIGITLCACTIPSSNSSTSFYSSTCTSSCIGITLSASLQFSSANM